MDILIGNQYTFLYPTCFTTLPDYTAHNLQKVTVIRQLPLEEADFEVQPMYEILAEDGWVGHAFKDELCNL